MSNFSWCRKDSIEDLTETFNGYDKVLFTVGSGGSTGADKTIIVDLDGAIKTIELVNKPMLNIILWCQRMMLVVSIWSKRWFKTIYNC